MTDLLYVLALLKVEGVGDVVAKKLLNSCGTAENVFKSKPQMLKRIDGIGEVLIKNIQDKSIFKIAEHEMRFIEDEKIQALYYQDSNYPHKLKHCNDGPVLLFSSGSLNFENRKLISIVGTRNVTSQGIEICERLVEDIAIFNPIIVSGFAYGVDIVAHKAALRNNLQTIGVLAHGLNQAYPRTHKKYVTPIKNSGGFLTEFWSHSNPEKENFVKRNRIVAGISEATIVIESAERGGSLITALMANDYNRDVFAVPGRITDKYSQGCNNLIKTQRAHLLTSAADLVYILNWDLKAKVLPPLQKQLFITLDPDEQLIYDYLQLKGKQLLDIIAIECNLPIYRVSTLLLNMEMKGVIRPLQGKYFQII